MSQRVTANEQTFQRWIAGHGTASVEIVRTAWLGDDLTVEDRLDPQVQFAVTGTNNNARVQMSASDARDLGLALCKAADVADPAVSA